MSYPPSSHKPNMGNIHRNPSFLLAGWLRISLMVSLLAVSSWIAIPLPFSPVPFTLQIVIVLLIPFVLKVQGAMMAIFIYLLMGSLGLPVFSGLHGGMAHLAGPTGGYLLGFFFAMPLMGGLAKKNMSLSILGGLLLIYFFGVAHLWLWTKLKLSEAIFQGFVLYFPLDFLKAIWVRWLVTKYRQIFTMESSLTGNLHE